MTNYSDAVFEKASAELAKRKSNALTEHQNRLDYIMKLSPEISKIQNELAKTGVLIMKTILSKTPDIHSELAKIQKNNLKLQNDRAELLEAFTGDRNYLDTPFTCKKCMDSGYVNGKRCECYNELLKKYAIEELNTCGYIKLNDFENFNLNFYDDIADNGISAKNKMKNQLIYCKNYAENFSKDNPSLLFIGKTGLGKTFMSSCIAKTVISNGYSVVFGSISDFLRAVENEHFGRSDTNTLEILNSCDLLILDDLGSEFRTQFYESAIYNIINSRINLDKPTIISTNLSANELNNLYNERIISRITGCFVPIVFVGKDIRHFKHKNI